MYVLHALFSDSGFWELWAEDGALVPAGDAAAKAAGGGASKGRGKAGAKSGSSAPTAKHPFALRPEDLAALLGTAGDEIRLLVRRADPRGAIPLALPSAADAPLPSADLNALLSAAEPKAAPQLRAWIVPTLVFEPTDGAALLAALENPDRLAVLSPGGGEFELPLGASVRYSRAVARFAEAVVHRGEILPALDLDDADEEYYASWRPKYSYETGAYRKLLHSAMPPVFRAQLLDVDLAGRPSGEVLDGAIGALVDAYVLEAFAGPHGLHGESLAPTGAVGRRTGPARLVRQWLNALTSMSSNQVDTGELEPAAVAEMAERIREWQSTNLEGRLSGPARICLRLVPPETEDAVERWAVELLLQSADDPSLVATAAEVWQRTGAARLLKAAGIDPRTELLAGLGRAARLFPALGPALRDSTPTQVPLNLDQAYDFLRHTAPALASLGFGVILPAWWSTGRSEVRLRLSTTEPAEQPGRVSTEAKLGFDQLVQYEWQASLGEQQLTGERSEEHTSELQSP